MTWMLQHLPLVGLLCVLCVHCTPMYSREPIFQNELAPSLVLDRINDLRDSIEKLQQMNSRVRCQIKELENAGVRAKRDVGPAQRLNDIIDVLRFSHMPDKNADC
ncbi:unnamed protein product [Auanema sp. JU1783]|nr:unnamed protein product [Auanema sp. JU1783]